MSKIPFHILSFRVW